jgi:transcription elongation factor GreA
MVERVPVTPTGLLKLRAAMKNLKEVQRPANVQAIEEAREHGDLKENAEYHSAKEKQSMIVAQIAMVSDRLARAQVIDPATLDMDKIAFGATVELLNLDTDEEVTYQIVGSEEADVASGRIAYDAPVARGMLGKEEGDEIRVKTPKGVREFEILSVEYK